MNSTRYFAGDIIEVINSRYTNMQEVERAGGECSYWLSMKMTPPIVGQRFRVVKDDGNQVVVEAGGTDRFGNGLTHRLEKASVMLYRTNPMHTLKRIIG